jgi:hypothetical protein
MNNESISSLVIVKIKFSKEHKKTAFQHFFGKESNDTSALKQAGVL